jgi:hypothetical protein
MPIIEGTTQIKTAAGEYDFATDGGAVGSITLRSAGGASLGAGVPAGSVITGGYVEVDTALTSGGSATVAVTLEGAGDLVAAAAISGAPWSSTGRKSIIPAGTGATSVKTTVARNLTATVAVAALTAGTFRVVIYYR